MTHVMQEGPSQIFISITDMQILLYLLCNVCVFLDFLFDKNLQI